MALPLVPLLTWFWHGRCITLCNPQYYYFLLIVLFYFTIIYCVYKNNLVFNYLNFIYIFFNAMTRDNQKTIIAILNTIIKPSIYK